MNDLLIKIGMDLSSFILKNTPNKSHFKIKKNKDTKDINEKIYSYICYGYINYEPVIIDYNYSLELNKSYMTINNRYNTETLEMDGYESDNFTPWFNKIIERDLL